LITSTGIGSGLDISAIVSSLTTAFGAAQTTQLTNQQNTLDSEVSAYGTFTAALDTLKLSRDSPRRLPIKILPRRPRVQTRLPARIPCK
jgi:flagellar capping protein FliD